MINAPAYTIKGVESDKVSLPDKVFGVSVSEQLLAQVVRVYLSNQRVAKAKTKTRGEVNKTTAKMYKQKGTGRARHGSYSAPVFVGGGIAHGPTGTQNYKLKLTEKMKQLALLGALSDKAKEKAIIVLSDAKKSTNKTKDAKEVLNKFGESRKTLLVVTRDQLEMAKSWRNLEKVNVIVDEFLNPYIVMVNKRLVITEEVIESLKKKYVA